MRNESELIDQFIRALFNDPDAPAPSGLDTGLAHFIRALVHSQQVTATQDVKARVWQRAYIAAQAAAYQKSNSREYQPMQTAINRSQSMSPVASRTANYLTILAASMILIILSGVMLGYMLNRQPNPTNGAGNAAASSTPTPVGRPTLTETSTPFPPTVPPLVDPAADPSIQNADNPPSIDNSVQMQPTIVPPDLIPGLVPTAVLETGERVNINQTITGTLPSDTHQAAYTFTVDADSMVYVVATSADFNVLLGYQMVQPAANGNSGGGGGGGGGGNADSRRGEIFTYATKGTDITIVVSSQQPDDEGTFTLGLYQLEAVQLLDDKRIESAIHTGESDPGKQRMQYFTFAGNPGDLVSLSVESDGNIDLMMTVQELTIALGYSSTQINRYGDGCNDEPYLSCSDNDGGKGTDPELTDMLIRRKNMFAVFVRPVVLSVTGTFSITLTRQKPENIGDNKPQTITISSRVRAGAAIFNGVAGGPVTINARILSGESRVPVRVTVSQNGQSLAVFRLSNTATFQQQVIPATDGQLEIIAEYEGQPDASVVSEIEVGYQR